MPIFSVVRFRGHLDVLYGGDLVPKRSFSRVVFVACIAILTSSANKDPLLGPFGFIADPSEQPARLFRREIVPSDGWIQIDAHFVSMASAIEDTEFSTCASVPTRKS